MLRTCRRASMAAIASSCAACSAASRDGSSGGGGGTPLSSCQDMQLVHGRRTSHSMIVQTRRLLGNGTRASMKEKRRACSGDGRAACLPPRRGCRCGVGLLRLLSSCARRLYPRDRTHYHVSACIYRNSMHACFLTAPDVAKVRCRVCVGFVRDSGDAHQPGRALRRRCAPVRLAGRQVERQQGRAPALGRGLRRGAPSWGVPAAPAQHGIARDILCSMLDTSLMNHPQVTWLIELM
jgi:hypothetical protein